MAADIISSLNKRELSEFNKDFRELIRVSWGMNKVYGKGTEKLSDYMSSYKSIIDSFNKKYKGVKLKLLKTVDELKLVVMLNEKGVKELFMNVASKINGLKSIGVKGFDEVSLEESDKFTNKIASIKDELYISYFYPENGDSFYLKFNDKEEMVELMFNYDIVMNEESQEFKLCAYYAVKQGFDETIAIHDEAASFGFIDVLTARERRSFLNKFEPRMLE